MWTKPRCELQPLPKGKKTKWSLITRLTAVTKVGEAPASIATLQKGLPGSLKRRAEGFKEKQNKTADNLFLLRKKVSLEQTQWSLTQSSYFKG